MVLLPSSGDQTQGVEPARQMLYHRDSHLVQPLDGFFPPQNLSAIQLIVPQLYIENTGLHCKRLLCQLCFVCLFVVLFLLGSQLRRKSCPVSVPRTLQYLKCDGLNPGQDLLLQHLVDPRAFARAVPLLKKSIMAHSLTSVYLSGLRPNAILLLRPSPLAFHQRMFPLLCFPFPLLFLLHVVCWNLLVHFPSENKVSRIFASASDT